MFGKKRGYNLIEMVFFICIKVTLNYLLDDLLCKKLYEEGEGDISNSISVISFVVL